MAGHGEKLSRKKELAVAALLSQPTIEAAAQSVGIGVQTLKGWLRLPEFKEACRQARLAVVETAINQLASLSGDVIATLRRNMTCGKPAAENRAAELAWTFVSRGIESMDLLERLEKIETTLKERTP